MTDATLQERPQGMLIPLQWARALAAVSVATGHILYEAQKIEGFREPARTLRDAFPFEVGVDIFFVLSGFIMVYTTHGKLGKSGFAWTFMKARLMRIVPLYWFYTLLAAGAALAIPSQLDATVLSISRFVYSLAFIPGIGEQIKPLLSLGWTLNFEMFFYVSFALAILISRSAVVWVVTGVFLLLLLSPDMALFNTAPFSFWITPILLEFCAGMWVAKLYFLGARLTYQQSLTLIGVAAVALYFGVSMQPDLHRAFALGIPSTMFIAALALVVGDQKVWQDTAGKRFLSLVGDASYTLYLAHPFILTASFVVFRAVGPTGLLGGIAYVIFSVLAVTGVSILAYKLIEVPLGRIVKHAFAAAPAQKLQ